MVGIVEILCHEYSLPPYKANMVGNTLSRMTMGSVSHVEEVKKYQVKDVHRLARLGVRLEDSQ